MEHEGTLKHAPCLISRCQSWYHSGHQHGDALAWGSGLLSETLSGF